MDQQRSIRKINLTVFATTIMGKCSRVGFTFRVSQTQTTSPETQTEVSGHCWQNFPCKIANIQRYTNMKREFKVQRRNANTEYKYEIQFLMQIRNANIQRYANMKCKFKSQMQIADMKCKCKVQT